MLYLILSPVEADTVLRLHALKWQLGEDRVYRYTVLISTENTGTPRKFCSESTLLFSIISTVSESHPESL